MYLNIRRPLGANRRRGKALDYLLQSTIPDIADNPLSTGLRDCLLLVQRASLGTHGQAFTPADPYYFPLGSSWGPLKSSKNNEDSDSNWT